MKNEELKIVERVVALPDMTFNFPPDSDIAGDYIRPAGFLTLFMQLRVHGKYFKRIAIMDMIDEWHDIAVYLPACKSQHEEHLWPQSDLWQRGQMEPFFKKCIPVFGVQKAVQRAVKPDLYMVWKAGHIQA